MRAISGRQLDRHSPHHEIGFTRAPDQTGGVAGSASPNGVAGPRNGVDQPALEAVVDLLAQTVDVHIDDVAARLGTAQGPVVNRSCWSCGRRARIADRRNPSAPAP